MSSIGASSQLKAWFLVAVSALISGAVWSMGPIAQSEEYHNFADQAKWGPIPNGLNVLTNLAFLASSYMGIHALWTNQAVFRKKSERAAYWVMFVSLFFVAWGSAYYHWYPTTTTLFWDRLPMTITFMSIVSVLFCEKIDDKLGQLMLIPLCLIGVASVTWWSFTEAHPDYAGDLRFYILVQVAPVVLSPIVVYLYPSKYSHAEFMYICAVLYIASKLVEFFDHGVWHLSFRVLSGHSLKHILAAAGTSWIPSMIKRRVILKIK